MIERATLVEQEYGDAILFWISDGNLRWLSGTVGTLREVIERCELPNLEHYRISDDKVHGTPGTPEYRLHLDELFDYSKKGAA